MSQSSCHNNQGIRKQAFILGCTFLALELLGHREGQRAEVHGWFCFLGAIASTGIAKVLGRELSFSNGGVFPINNTDVFSNQSEILLIRNPTVAGKEVSADLEGRGKKQT
jgi:hypothetical protein